MATFKDRLNRVFTPRPVKVSPKSRSRYEDGKYVADVEISQKPEVRAALKRTPLLGARLVETPKPHVEAISACDASNAARRIESLSRRGDKALSPREVIAKRSRESRVIEPPRVVESVRVITPEKPSRAAMATAYAKQAHQKRQAKRAAYWEGRKAEHPLTEIASVATTQKHHPYDVVYQLPQVGLFGGEPLFAIDVLLDRDMLAMSDADQRTIEKASLPGARVSWHWDSPKPYVRFVSRDARTLEPKKVEERIARWRAVAESMESPTVHDWNMHYWLALVWRDDDYQHQETDVRKSRDAVEQDVAKIRDAAVVKRTGQRDTHAKRRERVHVFYRIVRCTSTGITDPTDAQRAEEAREEEVHEKGEKIGRFTVDEEAKIVEAFRSIYTDPKYALSHYAAQKAVQKAARALDVLPRVIEQWATGAGDSRTFRRVPEWQREAREKTSKTSNFKEPTPKVEEPKTTVQQYRDATNHLFDLVSAYSSTISQAERERWAANVKLNVSEYAQQDCPRATEDDLKGRSVALAKLGDLLRKVEAPPVESTKRYVVSYLERGSGGSLTPRRSGEYRDPSAAHERAMKAKSEGHANVRVEVVTESLPTMPVEAPKPVAPVEPEPDYKRDLEKRGYAFNKRLNVDARIVPHLSGYGFEFGYKQDGKSQHLKPIGLGVSLPTAREAALNALLDPDAYLIRSKNEAFQKHPVEIITAAEAEKKAKVLAVAKAVQVESRGKAPTSSTAAKTILRTWLKAQGYVEQPSRSGDTVFKPQHREDMRYVLASRVFKKQFRNSVSGQWSNRDSESLIQKATEIAIWAEDVLAKHGSAEVLRMVEESKREGLRVIEGDKSEADTALPGDMRLGKYEKIDTKPENASKIEALRKWLATLPPNNLSGAELRGRTKEQRASETSNTIRQCVERLVPTYPKEELIRVVYDAIFVPRDPKSFASMGGPKVDLEILHTFNNEQWAQMERGAKVLLIDLQAYVNKHKSDAQLAMEKKRAEWEEAALTRKQAADAYRAAKDKEQKEAIEKAIVDRHAEDQAFIASKLKGPTFKNSMSDKRYDWPSYVGVGDLVLAPTADHAEITFERTPIRIFDEYVERYGMWPLSRQEYQIIYAPTGARIFGAKSGVQARKVFDVFTHSPTLLALLTWYTRRAGNPKASPVKGAVDYDDASIVADTGKIPAFIKLLQQNTDVDLALSESGLGNVIEEVRQAKLRTGKKGILATNYTPAAVQIMANLRKLASGKGKGGGRDDAGWIVDTIAVPDIMDAIQKTYSRLQGGASPEKCASAIDDYHVFYDAKKGRHHIKAGAVIVGQVERYLREHAGTPRAIAESLHTERMERIAQKDDKLANDTLMQAMMRSPNADPLLLTLGEKVLSKDTEQTPEEERAFADLPGPVSRKREALAKAILRSHKVNEKAGKEDQGAKPLGTFNMALAGGVTKPWPFWLRAGEMLAHRLYTPPGRPSSAKWAISNEKTGKLMLGDIANKRAAGDAIAWFAMNESALKTLDTPEARRVLIARAGAPELREALFHALRVGDTSAADEHLKALLASAKTKG